MPKKPLTPAQQAAEIAKREAKYAALDEAAADDETEDECPLCGDPDCQGECEDECQ